MNSPITIEEVKKWLISYGELQTAIENQRERLDTLRSRLEAPRTATWTGLPGGGDRADRLGVELGRVEELENELTENRAAARQLYREIDSVISQISGPGWPDRRFVVRARYLDGCQWEEISKMLFRRKADYEGKEDSYLRRCFEIHRKALADLVGIYEEHMRRLNDHDEN